MQIINSQRNKTLIDFLFLNINRKSIADCIYLLLNINDISISLEIKDIKEDLIEKLIKILTKSNEEYESEFEELKGKFNLPKLPKDEFDSNRFYFYEEKINVNNFFIKKK